MQYKRVISSSLITLFLVVLIVGCTRYKTAVLKVSDNTSLQGSSIIAMLQSLGKPTTVTYYNDETSQLEWTSVTTTFEKIQPFLKNTKIQERKGSLLCDITITVDTLGKMNTHSLTCYQYTKEPAADSVTYPTSSTITQDARSQTDSH